VKYRVQPNGYWEKYEYASGAVVKTTSPFGTAPVGATENVRIRSLTREEGVKDTEVETVVFPGGSVKEVSRTYRLFDYNQIRTVRCLTPGATSTATDNLVAIATVYNEGSAAGEFIWQAVSGGQAGRNGGPLPLPSHRRQSRDARALTQRRSRQERRWLRPGSI
jgi:hypothetical protein